MNTGILDQYDELCKAAREARDLDVFGRTRAQTDAMINQDRRRMARQRGDDTHRTARGVVRCVGCNAADPDRDVVAHRWCL